MSRRAPAAVLVAALVASLVSAAPPVAAATLPPTEWVIGPQQPVVMLVFNGQMRGQHLTEILSTLEAKGARASFFMAGKWVRYHGRQVRSIRLAGHRVGSAGYGTAAFTSMSDQEIRTSLERARRALSEVGVYPKPFLSFPKGQRDLRVLRVAGSAGYRGVRWSYRARGGFASNVKRKVVRHAQAGAIISLDPWRRSHREALSAIIDGVRRRSFGLRTVDTLLNSHPIRWDVTVRAGSAGPEVAYLQKQLGSTSYPVGARDGNFGYATLQSVYAFEKVHHMTRDGVVPPAEMAKIAVARRPRAPHKQPSDYIDVDISRQVLFEVRDGRVTRTLPMSSGNEEYYYVDGERYRAHTPRGMFQVQRKISGKRVSRLGTLYDPVYFIGGYAFHGSQSVPTYPASHGCIRLPMYVSKAFHDRTPTGLRVFVHD